jgi:hypothetical protein
MPAVSSCRSPNSLTCSPRERVTKLLLLSHPCFGFATEPARELMILLHTALFVIQRDETSTAEELRESAGQILNRTRITKQ